MDEKRLITVSSTGFGRALASSALAQGDRVIVTARNVSQIQDLEHKYPKTAKAVRLDVIDQASIQSEGAFLTSASRFRIMNW